VSDVVHSKAAVTIGVFDGVHVGHRMLLGVLKSEAARLGGLAVVLTFDAHPAELLAPDRAPLYITTQEQKVQLLKEAGADLVVVSTFDRDMADLTPEEFVDHIIVEHLKGGSVVVGSNFRFGHRRAGDVDVLRQLGEDRGFRVISAEPAMIHGSPVSSTRVRHALERGDVALAADLLGRPFTMLGRVVMGLGLGRKLGYPTANIEVASRQLVPHDGVYAVKAAFDGTVMPGVCSIGTRPTIGITERTIEVLIDGFEGDIYDAELATTFHARLRDQIKFESLEKLTEQIALDVQAARKVLEAGS
jgi:riboflavin kinase / FMN adenylyltransferase